MRRGVVTVKCVRWGLTHTWGSKGFDGECEDGEAIRRRALYVF